MAQSPPAPDVFHIGYQRTGTTFLQRRFFPRLGDEVLYLRKADLNLRDGELIFKDAQAQSRIIEARRRDQVVLFSQESIAGDRFRDNLQIGRQIQRLNPDARILLCVRCQYTHLPSHYYLTVKDGYTGKFGDYLEAIAEGRKFQLDRITGSLYDWFDKDRVRILLYEDFKERPQVFFDSIVGFLGCRWAPHRTETVTILNRSHSDFMVTTRRLTNRAIAASSLPSPAANHLRASVLWLASAVEQKMWLPATGRPMNWQNWESYRPRINELFAQSNQRFFDLVERSPDGYGYPGL